MTSWPRRSGSTRGEPCKVRIACHEERVGPLLGKCRECHVEFLFAADEFPLPHLQGIFNFTSPIYPAAASTCSDAASPRSGILICQSMPSGLTYGRGAEQQTRT